MEIIKKGNLYKTKVLYRGMSGLNQYFAQITNDRTNFYGSLSDNTTSIIKKYLKIKNPTFATFDSSQASMFGEVHIFIPELSDKLYSNDKIRDIMAETNNEKYNSTTEQEKLAREYKQYTIKNIKGKEEIIVDSKNYYLLSYIGFTKSFRTKFFTPKKSIENLTYGDIYDAIKAYVGLEEWKIKNGKRKSFEDNKKDEQNSRDRLQNLMKARKSPEQLKVRLKNMKDFLDAENIQYKDSREFEIEFNSQKAAKEAFKKVKEKMESRNNETTKMNLDNIDYLDGELYKKFIKIK